MSSKQDTISKTLLVAFLLCVVCSVIVASSVVLLKPIQQKNKALNLKENILVAAGLLESGQSAEVIEAEFAKITPKLVDIETGEYVGVEAVNKTDIASYDQKKASKDPALSIPLEREDDIAGLKRRARYAKVYVVENNGKVERIIIPVKGYGLWSTLYGFLALEGDANTIVGLGFYEHAETPGLGGEVDNPNWKAQWPGKNVYDLTKGSEPQIRLVKGGVDRSRPDAIYGVDALSGATLTSTGVTNLLRYWLGSDGFQKYLDRMRKEA
ncbi:MAG: Na(+)-translocating NADH-quinone reductase subunit C [Proteobacteria bacterium]|nr:MAG: Na(+)-translocating NADH-quinone reductase subunit C [Pseudomonadota bacterium]